MQIAESVAVVTGGASGIGRATAIALAGAGADVVVSDIDGSGAESVASEIEVKGRRALAIRTDVGRREEVEELVERAVAWQGRCDLFVSNAGIGCEGAAHEFTVKDWESILAIDLMASIWATRRLVPYMLNAGTGHIAFVTSIWGYDGNAELAPYCVAKFGLVGLAESLAKQLQPTGVGVSLIVPGAVKTQGGSRYVFAGSDTLTTEELNALRAAARERVIGATPESMAATIVEGLRAGRFHILQTHPTDGDWLGNLLRRKASDPDAFVLGS